MYIDFTPVKMVYKLNEFKKEIKTVIALEKVHKIDDDFIINTYKR
jgi:hypothetical protein